LTQTGLLMEGVRLTGWTGFMQNPQSFALGVLSGFPLLAQGRPYIDKT